MPKKAFILILMVGLISALLGATMAWFHDTGFSRGNVFQAGFWAHDVATTSVTPNTRRVYAGPPVQSYLNITVEAKNNGTLTETFNVTAYYNATKIETQTVTNLEPNQTKILNFIWNTTEMTPCICYRIRAEADTIPGETNTLNNIFIDGWVWILIPGDINADGDVDYFDFLAFAAAYLKTSGQSGYNLEADFDLDGDVDYFDFLAFAANYLKKC